MIGEVATRVDVDPLVFQSYKAVAVFATSLILVAFCNLMHGPRLVRLLEFCRLYTLGIRVCYFLGSWRDGGCVRSEKSGVGDQHRLVVVCHHTPELFVGRLDIS